MLKPARIAPAALLIAAAAATTHGAPDAKAKDALQRAADALEGLEAVTMRAAYEPGGGLSDLFPIVEGRIRAARLGGDSSGAENGGGEAADADESAPMSYRITGRGKRNKNADQLEFDVVRHDGRYEWIDHEDEVVRSRSVEAQRLSSQRVSLARELIPGALFGPAPFKGMLESEDLALGEPAEIDGERYTVVEAPVDERRVRHVYLDQETHLPRRIEVKLESQLISGWYRTDFTGVDTETNLGQSDFRITAPDGYRHEGDRAERPDGLEPGQQRDRTGQPDNSQDSREQAAEVRRSAPGFELETPDGETVSLESLSGSIVVLDFWATWCQPCLKASPEVQELHEDYAEESVRVIGMNFRQSDPQDAIDYMEENGYTYGLLLEADEARRAYNVSKFPTYVLIDAEGKIIESVSGYKEGETFPRIREIIDEELERMDDG